MAALTCNRGRESDRLTRFFSIKASQPDPPVPSDPAAAVIMRKSTRILELGSITCANYGDGVTKGAAVMNIKAVFLSAALALSTYQATAQNQNCSPHDSMVARLADQYGESRQAIAMDSTASVVEVFASLETGTWTITVTQPGGGNLYRGCWSALSGPFGSAGG